MLAYAVGQIDVKGVLASDADWFYGAPVLRTKPN
jgi:hypothetical protein